MTLTAPGKAPSSYINEGIESTPVAKMTIKAAKGGLVSELNVSSLVANSKGPHTL